MKSPATSFAIPAWAQAAPFALVFAVFFVIPLAFVVLVSFWDYNDYEIVRSSRSAAMSKRSRAAGTRCPSSAQS